MDELTLAKENMLLQETLLSDFACKNHMAIPIKETAENDIRPTFFRDIDKIIHSSRIYKVCG
ncbi:MAG: hypothetical protein FWC68_06175 [Oscillospiraceae bacterium]|nr:hypothetical protein [Oscillospiraceae bacterium]